MLMHYFFADYLIDSDPNLMREVRPTIFRKKHTSMVCIQCLLSMMDDKEVEM
jgi:hypothetical protein